MAKIAILNDEPEVVTLLSRFLTLRRDALLRRVGDAERVVEQVVAFQPELILVPLYRPPELIGRPIDGAFHEIRGLAWLETLSRTPELRDIPLVIFSFSVRQDELPAGFLERIQPRAFLRFPEGLQELNPVISGLVGPAQGSADDVDRLRASLTVLEPDEPEP